MTHKAIIRDGDNFDFYVNYGNSKLSSIRKSLYVEKFTLSNFNDYIKNSIGEELEEESKILEIAETFQQANRNYIWRIQTDGLHGGGGEMDDIKEFHSLKVDAIEEILTSGV